jgi:hypothetical protein
MGKLFLLLIGLYICTFIYNNLGLSSNSFNFSKYIDIFKDTLYRFFRKLALYYWVTYKNINKLLYNMEKYSSLIKCRRYLLIAFAIHILILFICGKCIIFTKIKNNENWVYTELSNQDIEDKSIAESAPNEPNNFSEPDFIENSQDNEPNSSMSNGVDIFSEKTEIPTEAIIPAPAPVIASKFSKININFKPEESQQKIKWGKEIVYNEGKIIGINGFGSDGNGSSSQGRGSGNGNGNGNGLKEGKVFGTNIKAKKLGVIFDVSYSMSPYTKMVEKEIKKSFPEAIVYYVDGCSIDSRTQSIQAFESLSFQSIDAVYWFCDLQDPETKNGLSFLNDLLKSKKIKLYIKTMDKHPNSMLKSIISSTGGSYSFGLN